MLTYNLEEKDNIPLYEYIYKCIKRDIITGTIKPHEKLPSKRAFAQNLSVSLITVENAYNQLLYEGYIYSALKKGYYASDIGSYSHITSVPQANINSTINSSEDTNYVSSKTEYDVDFGANHTNPDLFPFATWARITRNVLNTYEADLLKKTENIGHYKLRLSISRYLLEYKGMSVNPDNIIIGAGMEYLYSLILQLLGRTKMIAVEDPGHTKVSRIYESNGIKVLPIPLDDYGFNPDKLGFANISCIHISPSHQFPTGIIMPASRRHSLITLAKERDFFIIEDDYDSELRYNGRPFQAMASLAPDNVIYMNTFTRTLMNSVRVAYMVLPDELKQVYTNRFSFYSCTVSSLDQLILSEFIDGGYYERHINRTRQYYKKCRKTFISCFYNSGLHNHFDIIENNAGLHFLIKAKEAIDDKLYLDRLAKKKIGLTSISSYCNRPENKYEHLFLINYFSIDESVLKDTFDLMATIIPD